ncbi:MAG: molybdopterin-dependent oxidoreductase [Bacteroidota bacterium]
MQRREFLKISALGLGGLAVSGTILHQLLNMSDEEAIASFGRFPTYCEICFWQCAGWAHTDKDGKIQKLTGNDADPHCNGRLCPRGTGGLGAYYDNDRLKKPLIRVNNSRGQQTFREASWDEAFDLIAKRMKYISGKFGPESIALFHHGSGGKYFTNLIKAFGSDNIAKPSFAQCMGPRETAFAATFGAGLGSPEPLDIRDTKCLVLIGSHLGENMHNAQVQEMSDAIDKVATIITVDPRFSTAASKSKFWLPIKPATDIALLLSWMNVVIANEWYDKQFVEINCEGFEQLKQHVAPFTPEWAYGITTIEPDVIVKSAKAMHDASPAVIIHPGRHTTWYGDDTQRLRAVAILNALFGNWGQKGGFYLPDKAEMKHHHLPEFPKPKWTWKDTTDGKYNLVDLGLSNVIVDASIPKKNADNSKLVKAWFVVGTNLIQTLPNTPHTLEAIQNLELLVAVDTMPMEITGWADVVLPECTYLERFDSLRVSQNREANISLRMPAAKPLNDTKSAWWMTRELGIKLGLKDYFPFKTQEEELDWELKEMGSSLAEMKKIGVKTIPTPDHELYIPKGSKYEFNTDSGKVQLYSTAFEAEGFPPLPVYTKHPEPAEGYYRLNYGRAPMHTFGRTTNNANLTDLMDENTVWVNPKVAKIWDLKEGQYVKLKNQDDVVSSFSIKVRITERIRHDSVYIVHGFGHTDKRMNQSFGKGASDTELITNVMTDPIMGGTGMRGNFVTFEI